MRCVKGIYLVAIETIDGSVNSQMFEENSIISRTQRSFFSV